MGHLAAKARPVGGFGDIAPRPFNRQQHHLRASGGDDDVLGFSHMSPDGKKGYRVRV